MVIQGTGNGTLNLRVMYLSNSVSQEPQKNVHFLEGEPLKPRRTN
jgi:hypothetical protein